ncbi:MULTISPECIES: cell division protein FtsQ/DivIB [Jeotgalicoccus]|uniref:cell division protein FtsQ/DivIB n=1 Tax=Jeotgalicoccus TaxID=227979 RepID=UPI00041B125D|nr:MULTISPECIES: FtsQ-type POTRA domain-containing protein [Jeotgalicoccus]QQD85790.1 FtsQ-type POTRA domain-containing protein [Jeotgalicoccus sp. ATCC 8456]
MSEKDNNVDDIKEKLKKKRQNTEYTGYTPRSLRNKDKSGEENKDVEVKVPKDSGLKKEAKANQSEKDIKSTPSDDLKVEHYKDFDNDENAKSPDTKEKSNAKDQEKKTKKKEKTNKIKSDKKDKPPREKFQFKRVHAYIIGIVVLVILLGTLLWYVFSSASDVKEITFTGNSIVSESELEERIGFQEGDKMFSISLGKASENIELLPVIKEVNASRDWPNGVTIDIEEYKAVAYINSEDLYFPVLENSRIQRGYPSAPRNAPIIYNFEGEEFDALVEALNNIEGDILENISEIYFRPTDNSRRRIHVFMNDGQEIVADYETFSEKMNYYIGIRQEIGEDAEGIIDMEVGTSFLPYDSADAREIKENIYNEPTSATYIEDINESLNGVRDTLSGMDQEEESETAEEAETESSEGEESAE